MAEVSGEARRDLWGPMLTRRLGGPLGRHTLRTSPAWVYGLATISWLVLMLRQMPCIQRFTDDSPDRFGWMCYTDLTALYFSRGQATGGIPYANVMWEYPVLTGYFATIANLVSQLFGAVLDPAADAVQTLTNGHIYFSVSAVGLFACWLWLISSMLRITPGSRVVATIVAMSPTVMTAGLINWDLLVVALTAAGLVAWLEDRPVWAGVWWGLGVAAKLYPVVIIGALFVLILRPEARERIAQLKAYVIMLGVSALTWLLANLPVMVTHPSGWAVFYTMNAGRAADWGSLWLALADAGIGVDNPATWSRVVMILGYIALAALIFFARRAPTAAQIAYLAVVVMVIGNLVYSPQYVLWVLPLVAIVRPKVVDITVFTVSELIYFIFIWLHLRGNDLTLGINDRPWVYVFATLLRIAATLWVVARVVRDVLAAPPPPAVTPPDL